MADQVQSPEELRLLDNLKNVRLESEREASVEGVEEAYANFFASCESGAFSEEQALKHPCVKFVHIVSRFEAECPVQEVQERLRKILAKFAQLFPKQLPHVSRTVSAFIPQSRIVPLSSSDDLVAEEFVRAFESDGRVSHMTRIMAFHPEYLKCFREAHNTMLWGEGPLSVAESHFIAILAASRYSCEYLISIHSEHFLDVGGDSSWLQGADHLPAKMQLLLPLNSTLAYRPFRVCKEDINKLLKADESRWTIQELMQAIAILTHFHALCLFIYGTGTMPEIDMQQSDQDVPTAAADETEEDGTVPDVVAVLKSLTLQPDDSAPSLEEAQDADDPQDIVASTSESRGESAFDAPGQIEPGYEEYDIRRLAPHEIRTFSWQDHGFSVMQRYYPQAADLIDACFVVIKNMTYAFIGNMQDVDTFEFRWAVWNYVMRVIGIVDADYHYGRINDLLGIPVKTFIKKLVCNPQGITVEEFRTFFPALKDSERVHVTLLVMEAKRQAELLFCLKAMSP